MRLRFDKDYWRMTLFVVLSQCAIDFTIIQNTFLLCFLGITSLYTFYGIKIPIDFARSTLIWMSGTFIAERSTWTLYSWYIVVNFINLRSWLHSTLEEYFIFARLNETGIIITRGLHPFDLKLGLSCK